MNQFHEKNQIYFKDTVRNFTPWLADQLFPYSMLERKQFDHISEKEMQNLVDFLAHINDDSEAALDLIPKILLHTVNDDFFQNDDQVY